MYQIGDNVKLRFTGEDGTVVRIHPDGMLQLRIHGDPDERPVFPDDVVRPHAFTKIEKPEKPKKAGPPAKLKTDALFYSEEERRRGLAEHFGSEEERLLNQVALLGAAAKDEPLPSTDAGLFVAVQWNNARQSFTVYLVNDSPMTLILKSVLEIEGREGLQIPVTIASHTSEPVGELRRTDLNCNPRLTLYSERQGSSQVLLLKGKNILTKEKRLPLLKGQAAYFKPEWQGKADKNALQQRLAKVAEEHRKDLEEEPDYVPVSAYRVQQRAAFPTELDLHIEKLHPQPDRLEPKEILKMQLARFDAYIREAIELGVDRVFVIHGKGKGILKSMIDSRMKDWKKKHPELVWKNEYAAPYEFGATEIIINNGR